MHAVHVHDRDISRRPVVAHAVVDLDRKSTRLNSSHSQISYAVFCLKKKKIEKTFKRSYPCAIVSYLSFTWSTVRARSTPTSALIVAFLCICVQLLHANSSLYFQLPV